ncbi:MAG TPA: LuxR C-terminal-related transcriptional regulator, partial [Prolixibacteraceae bacterium]
LKALFNLTPNGLFLFDGHSVFEANPSLIQILGVSKDKLAISSIEDILDPVSYQKIKDKITRCTNGLLNSFCETVTLVPANGEKTDVVLYVSVYEKFSGCSLMVGLVIPENKKWEENGVLFSDVLSALRKENIKVTESMGNHLINIFKLQKVHIDKQKSGFFTKRENEVLCLSMEGLPIKMIADQLSISDRTVENHRAKLMEKTNSKNIIEVIAFALRNNLIDISMSIILFF